MNKILTILSVVLIVIVGIMFGFKEDLDRFNPLYTQEWVYVQINEKPEPNGPEGHRFEYNLTGYNAEGKKKKVTFSTSEKLQEGAYLKVWAKGAYTERWEEVQAESLPKTIKW